MKKNLLFSASLLFVFIFKAQQESTTSSRHYPSIMVGVGGVKFNGDVGTQVNPLLDARLGYYLKGEYRFGKHLGIMAGGMYGKLAGTDNSPSSHLNFESKAIQFDASLVTYFDHLFKQNDDVSPYLSVGIGYLMFDAYGDLKNSSGNYYYWSNGSIGNLPETPSNAANVQTLNRDYTYETQLKDSTTNYSRGALTIPIGTGFDFRIGKKWDVQVGFNYNIILSDYVDNHKSGGNDAYWMAHTGLKYTFVPREKTPSDGVKFTEIDHMDVDGDGVPDDVDKCLSTEKGVAVDKHGCPPDSDEDGVPNYKDKEPNSKKGANVDSYGVAFNTDSLAYHQIMWDSLAQERSESFNQNPSMNTLTKVENKTIKDGKWDHAKIPNEFKSADTNKDGYISAKEITAAVNDFFDGANDLTVDALNNMIDYFFEQ